MNSGNNVSSWVRTLVVGVAISIFILAGCSGSPSRDTTAPTLVNLRVSMVDSTAITVIATVDEESKLFWVVYTEGATAPADAAALIGAASNVQTASLIANSGSTGQVVSAADPIQIDITGLIIGTNYDLYAVVQDTFGNRSAPSPKFSISTLSPPVTSLSAAPVGGGSTSVALAWTLPASISNDASILQLRYATTRAELAGAAPVDITTTRAAILATTTYTLTAPLTDRTEYHFSVLIVGAAGSSLPLSGPSFAADATYVTTGTPDSTLPGAPAGLRITGLQSSSGGVDVTLRWQSPTDATNIELSWQPANPGTGKKTIPATAGMVQTDTITLNDESTYTISAVAINDANKRSAVARLFNQRIDTTTPAAPTNVMAMALGNGTITISWDERTDDVADYNVCWVTEINRARLGNPNPSHCQLADGSATSLIIVVATTDSLVVGSRYYFVAFARDGADALGNIRTSPPSMSSSVSTVAPAVTDSNNNRLIDIHNLDMLDSVRHSLNLSLDGLYRSASSGPGLLCGADGVTRCIGYELMRSLDFAVADDYANGTINTAWRPNNAGWEPLGTISLHPFLAIFDGNGYSISNLYSRRDASVVGLFGFVGSLTVSATVRNLVLVDGNVYGGSAGNNIGILAGNFRSGTISTVSVRNGSVNGEGGIDNAGGIVGSSNLGTISDSYADATVNGGADADSVGGLVGFSKSATVSGSYANSAVNGNAGDDRVGGLIGFTDQGGNRVIASHATGVANGGAGIDDVGGLVGENFGTIIASYATGDATVTVSDTGVDRVGGLVGDNYSRIIASYATGNASGNAADADKIGSLVGNNAGASTITASYAIGNANGEAGDDDSVGGLVGWHGGTGHITASYAAGNADGGAGSGDTAGTLIGDGSSDIVASYGFGIATGETTPAARSPRPSGITATGIAGARKLTATTPANTAAGAQWNDIAKDTANAWDFGTSNQAPALKYADYNGVSTGTDICALFPDRVTSTEIDITCGTTLLHGESGSPQVR